VVLEGSNLVSLLQFLLSGSRGNLSSEFSRRLYYSEIELTYAQGIIVLGFFNHAGGFADVFLLSQRGGDEVGGKVRVLLQY
jgi:hypothetical protein